MANPRTTCKKCEAPRDGTHTSYCVACYNQYKRDWYLRNAEKEIARAASYNRRNPHVPRAAMRRAREKRPEEYRRYTREYRAANPERTHIWSAKKRAQRKGQYEVSIGVTLEEWRAIKALYKNCCAYCRRPMKRLQMDHIVPLARGGLHEPSNIAPACAHCNNSKNAKPEIQFRQYLGQLI